MQTKKTTTTIYKVHIFHGAGHRYSLPELYQMSKKIQILCIT